MLEISKPTPNILLVTGERDKAMQEVLQKEVANAAEQDVETIVVHQISETRRLSTEDVFYVGESIQKMARENGPITMITKGESSLAGVVAFGQNHKIVDRVINFNAPKIVLSDTALPDNSRKKIEQVSGSDNLQQVFRGDLVAGQVAQLPSKRRAA